MSAGGVFFLVLFIVAVITAVVYGLYLYRKDRLCFKKNLEKCKSCKLWKKCKNCRAKKNVNPGNDSDVSALVSQKQ